MILILITSSVSSYALKHAKSYYDAISWTYTYAGPDTTQYNCLGYALGQTRWVWPWGEENPTIAQVDSFLKGGSVYNYTGYSTKVPGVKIIAYGKSIDDITKVVHFSKVSTLIVCYAKWGQLELFRHDSWDPYIPEGVYGRAIRYYV